jgi:2-dehydro-3-deoxygluconokinase
MIKPALEEESTVPLQRLEVVTFGEALTLMLAEGTAPVSHSRTLELGMAGAESNLAVGLARLGHQTAFFGRVGDDIFGHRIRRELLAEGIDTSHLVLDPDHPTGAIIRDAAGHRPITVIYRRAHSAACFLSPADVPSNLIAAARVLHVTGITAVLSESAFEATLHAVQVAKRCGVPVSFDPNVRHRLASPELWREITAAIAPYADIVLTGADDAAVVAPGEDPIEWFRARGARIVVVKSGAQGAAESDGTEHVSQPAHPVSVVDSVGAGDAFNAGWLSAWLRGRGAQQRLQEASVVGALVVATRGDTLGLPDAGTRDLVLNQTLDVLR